MPSIFIHQPTFASTELTLRPLRPEDAEALLAVYGDECAVPYFNGDNCHGDNFYYQTLDRVRQAMDFWAFSCREGYFVRWAIVENDGDRVVGTVELCDREQDGDIDLILRIDLRHDRERAEMVAAVLKALLPEAQGYFRGQAVVTKCWPYAGVRQKALEDFGFVPDERPIIGVDGTVYGDYWRLGSRNG